MSDQSTNTSPHVTIMTRPDGSTYAMPRFAWDLDREQAAVDVAEGKYSLTEIAKRACINVGALAAWRQHPDFRERVESHRKVFRELVLSYGIARKEVRIADLEEQRQKLAAIVKARAEAFKTNPELMEVPGGDTGYVYQHVTSQGPEYLIDNKTMAMQLDIGKQAAIELNEWNEGAGTAVAVQIVCPASAPPVSSAPTVTIGRVGGA